MQISHKQLTLLLMSLAGLGSIAVIVNFFKDRKLKDELLKIEHELRVLELEKMKSSTGTK